MKKKKSICLACAAGAVLLLLGYRYLQSDEKKIERYLEDRYGENFVVLNSSSSGDGRTPFSHTVTAFCTPADDPECIFRTRIENAGTQHPLYVDEYAKGILCQRMEKTVTEKLGDYFGEYFAECYIYQNFSPILQNMDDITYDDYFSGLYRNYPEQESGKIVAAYIITINSDRYEPQDYGAEYDLLYSVLKEMSDTLQIDGKLLVSFDPSVLYERELEWSMEHAYPYAMPTRYYHYDEKHMEDIPFEFYTIGYDHITLQSTSFYSVGEPLSREDYTAQREKGMEDAGNH